MNDKDTATPVAGSATSGTEPTETGASGPQPLSRSRLLGLRRLPFLISVTVLAVLTSGWSGSVLWTAVHGERAQIAQARDSVMEATAQALVNFHTLDHRDVDRGLDNWERSATGRFLDDLRKGRARDAQALRDSKTTTVGRTVSTSALDIDLTAGKATAIGVVEIVVTPERGEPVTKRDRVQVELQRTGTDWLLTSLAPVSVGA